MHGINISVGLVAFADALIAIILTGIKVGPHACKQRNIICELLALSLFGFNGSSALPTTIQLKISVFPKKKHLIAATTIAIIINADHILLRAILSLRFIVYGLKLSQFL